MIEGRRGGDLCLFTYIVGNAACWMLWAALAVSGDRWYWWLIVPCAGWAVVLVLHLRRAYRAPASGREQ